MSRIALVSLALLCSCSTVLPRPLPAADWAHDVPVSVQAPPHVPTGGSWTPGSAGVMKAQVEEDLSAAGMRVLSQPGQGQLRVAMGGLDWSQGESSAMTVSLERDREVLDRVTVVPLSLPCQAQFDLPALIRCITREVSARVLESRSTAIAFAQKTPTPAASPATRALSGKLAVLELRSYAPELTPQNIRYFTDVVRSAALRVQPGLQVMTRENLLVLLQASGKKLEECEGECEVDTGRRIGADQIVSGEVQRLGALYKLSLRLHDTHEGRLLGSQVASGKTIEELDAAAGSAAEALFKAR